MRTSLPNGSRFPGPVSILSPVALVLLAGLLAGCSSPNFARSDAVPRMQSADTTTVFVDVSIREDVKGSTDVIDLPRHEEVGEVLADTTAAWLRSMGLDPVVLPPTAGYWMQAREPLYVVRTPEDRSVDVDSLPTEFPPFVVDSLTARRIDLDVVKAARIPPKSERGADPEGPTEHVLVAASVEARSVGAGQQVAQSLVSGLLTLGMVSVHEATYAIADLRVIDLSNRQVLWSDTEAIQGMGRIDTDDLVNRLHDVVKKLQKRARKR